MDWYYYLIIFAAMVLILVAAVGLSSSLIVNSVVFGTRQDKNPKFRYFTPEDFNLTVEHMSVRYGGTELAANLYTVKPAEECKSVVIFQHGFGAGSSSYMTEIAHFSKQGNAVVAVDAYGCNNSGGKEIKGFYAGAEAVIAAYSAVNSDERLKNKKIILVGHSWGAYAVLAASGRIKVDGVVAMSGFNAPAQCVCDQMKGMNRQVRAVAPLVHPWLYIINFLRFGAKGNTKAVKALRKSGAKALLIHGEKDRAVQFKRSAANLAEGDNVTKLILPDKAHNPYNTVEAEALLAELVGGHKFANEQEADEYLAKFDWKAVTEEDEKVMSDIDSFIENV